MIYDVLNSTPLPRRKGPLTALESVPFHGTHCGWGLGERSSSSSGSGRSPTAKPFLVIFWFENEVWEAPKLSQQVRAEPDRKHAF